MFSIVAVLVCIPTNSVTRFRFLHTLSSIYCLYTFGTMVRHCGFALHLSDNEWCWTYFRVFVAICMSSLDKCLFSPLEHFFIGSFIFLGLSFRSCLYIYEINSLLVASVQFSSVTQSCTMLCDPMYHSTPGLPVHHQLPEFTQTQRTSSRWCHQTISPSLVPFLSWLQFLTASDFFPVSQLFARGGQSTGVSALESFLPENTQD